MTADDDMVAGRFGPMSRRAAIGSALPAGALERIGALKKISIAGGSATMLAPARAVARGGVWGDDNTVVFSPGVDTPLRRVPSAGGTPTDVTTLSVLEANSHIGVHHFEEDRFVAGQPLAEDAIPLAVVHGSTFSTGLGGRLEPRDG
jgi:hypothetical protein